MVILGIHATGERISAFSGGMLGFLRLTPSDSSCDVHIKLSGVAPFHCKLERAADGRVFVENLDKSYKTVLNGITVSERTFVPHDSLLTVVDRNFNFLYPGDSPWILKRVSRICFVFVSQLNSPEL